jgi:hypothetical protein
MNRPALVRDGVRASPRQHPLAGQATGLPAVFLSVVIGCSVLLVLLLSVLCEPQIY